MILYPADMTRRPNSNFVFAAFQDRLVPTTSLSQSDAVRVDFFRKPIGDMPIVTPLPDEAPISIIFFRFK